MPPRPAQKVDWITAHVTAMNPARYTVAQAAELTGRSVDTLVRWRKQKVYIPSDKMKTKNMTIYLYTDGDLEALATVAKLQRPGRKAKDQKPMKVLLAEHEAARPSKKARKKVVR